MDRRSDGRGSDGGASRGQYLLLRGPCPHQLCPGPQSTGGHREAKRGGEERGGEARRGENGSVHVKTGARGEGGGK